MNLLSRQANVETYGGDKLYGTQKISSVVKTKKRN
jgi:hypothetical protein